MRVLVVEDDALIAREIVESLGKEGYLVQLESDGKEGWFAGSTEDFAAIVLDLGLPGMDGLSVLRRWRREGCDTPVLILTARGSWEERVEGIDAGADDYLPKPFKMPEMLARVRALIRRASGQSSSVLKAGKLALDMRSKRLSIDDVDISISPLEMRCLSYLLLNKGRAVSQAELTEQLYAQDFERDSTSVEVLIGRLRRKIGRDSIQTRRGFGYIIEDDEPA